MNGETFKFLKRGILIFVIAILFPLVSAISWSGGTITSDGIYSYNHTQILSSAFGKFWYNMTLSVSGDFNYNMSTIGPWAYNQTEAGDSRFVNTDGDNITYINVIGEITANNITLGNSYIQVGALQSAPANPPYNSLRVYAKNDSGTYRYYILDSDGIETDLTGGGGGCTTLDCLSDVGLNAPDENDVLIYIQGQWINAKLNHTLFSDGGTYTHTEIDTAVDNSVNHIADTNNPHSTTAEQIQKTAGTYYVGDYVSDIIDTLVGLISAGGNSSFNESHTNTKYANINYSYNQTIPANEYTNSVNASTSSWISDTFLKITDALSQYASIIWAYNQTTISNAYTDTSSINLQSNISYLDTQAVHKNGTEYIYGVKNFYDNVNFYNGTFFTSVQQQTINGSLIVTNLDNTPLFSVNTSESDYKLKLWDSAWINGTMNVSGEIYLGEKIVSKWLYNQTSNSIYFYNQTSASIYYYNQTDTIYYYNQTLPLEKWNYNQTIEANKTIYEAYGKYFYNMSDGSGAEFNANFTNIQVACPSGYYAYKVFGNGSLGCSPDVSGGGGGGGDVTNSTVMNEITIFGLGNVSGTTLTYTNMPADVKGFMGDTASQFWKRGVDLSSVTRARFSVWHFGANVPNGLLYLQYSKDAGTTWTNLSVDNTGAISLATAITTSFKTTEWNNIVIDARETNVTLRIASSGGNGVLDPTFRGAGISLQSPINGNVTINYLNTTTVNTITNNYYPNFTTTNYTAQSYDFTSYVGYTWTNMPLALTEAGANQIRIMTPIASAEYFRLVTSMSTTYCGVNAGIYAQYSLNNVTWLNMSIVNSTLSCNLTGGTNPRMTSFEPIPSGAKTDNTLMRVVGYGGDGVIDPVFRQIRLQTKSPMLSENTSGTGGGNSSFNETYTNTMYANKNWSYNQTSSSIYFYNQTSSSVYYYNQSSVTDIVKWLYNQTLAVGSTASSWLYGANTIYNNTENVKLGIGTDNPDSALTISSINSLLNISNSQTNTTMFSISTSSTSQILGTRVFVTTSQYNGDLGGIAGADAKCMADANKPAGGTGVWKALILGGNRYAGGLDWVLQLNRHYYLRDGTTSFGTVDETYGLFWNGIGPPRWNAFDNGLEAVQHEVWTGDDGTAYIYQTCIDWTESTNELTGSYGFSDATDVTLMLYDTSTCDNTYHLYCVEQDASTTSGKDLSYFGNDVGIKTTATSSTLTVNGNFSATTIYANGNLVNKWLYNHTTITNISIVTNYGKWFYNQTLAVSNNFNYNMSIIGPYGYNQSLSPTITTYLYNWTIVTNKTMADTYGKFWYNMTIGTSGGGTNFNDSTMNLTKLGVGVAFNSNYGLTANSINVTNLWVGGCPIGFTRFALGCMETAEQPSVANMTSAILNCSNSYGARIPSSQEWFVAFNQLALTNETGNKEWVADGVYTDFVFGVSCITYNSSRSGDISYSNTNSCALTFNYRCYIPFGGGRT